jgi:hypothetical protein
MPGTLDELRTRALLDLLQGRDSRANLPSQQPPGPSSAAGADGTAHARPPAQDRGAACSKNATVTIRSPGTSAG